MRKNTFKKITVQNYKDVKKWSKYKRSIIISADAAKSGKLINKKE